MTNSKPKVFVSYSWSSPGHFDQIRSYAERLISDGIDVVLDQWDLSEGQDKFAFMEKMVTDVTVTHVLIFSDQVYATKADKRAAGVGTESQIISKEIYDKIDQKKFIPIVCERQQDNEPCLPTFLKSRIWVDFSSPEAVNDNWERLLRVIYGKPLNEKPSLGEMPLYLNDDLNRPALPTIGKFAALRDAVVQSKPAIGIYRDEFINTIISFADKSRIRARPTEQHYDERILKDLHDLLPLRDQIIEWLKLEVSVTDETKLEAVLFDFLEKLLPLKYRPKEVSTWTDGWFDAHAIFVYEVFVYSIAVLITANKFNIIRSLVNTHYLLP